VTKILIVEDEKAIAEVEKAYVLREGYEADIASDGAEALRMFNEGNYDLVLLDLMLPGIKGERVCEEIRAVSSAPIIMITAKSGEGDVIAGLEAGADDYIIKPFKVKELVARVRARLRADSRIIENTSEQLRIGDLTISTLSHTVRRGDTIINLTPLEFDLLVALAKRPRQVLSRESLLEEVWGYRHAADTRLVNVHVQRLRSKIELDPEHPEIVVTVRGVGYRAGEQVTTGIE